MGNQAIKNNHQYLYVISVIKLSFMALITGGLYLFYWWYKQWDHISKYKNVEISPFLYSIFHIFFISSFLRHITNNKYFSYLLFTCFYILLFLEYDFHPLSVIIYSSILRYDFYPWTIIIESLTSRAPDIFTMWISFLMLLWCLLIQMKINFHAKKYGLYKINKVMFSKIDVLWVISFVMIYGVSFIARKYVHFFDIIKLHRNGLIITVFCFDFLSYIHET